MKILHVLDHYKPLSDGYVFRSSYILLNQQALGLDLAIVTSPKQGPVPKSFEEIDSIPVYRTIHRDFLSVPFIREFHEILSLRKRILDIIKKEKPDVIHAHSPSLNGIAALLAGRAAGIPVVYEVRAFWEDAAVEQHKWSEGSLKYKVSRIIESALLRRVDHAFAICSGLVEEICHRGLPPNKVGLIRNCVDSSRFTPQAYDAALAEKHGLTNKTVLGFIGSFFDFEGLDLMIDAFKRILQTHPDSRLLLVGDGVEKRNLEKKALEMGINDQIIFTGIVPHSDVLRYYSIIDVLVYPRKSLRLTELTTPLKPLEAMAQGKVVLGSDVGGIRELVTDNVTGFLFRAGDLDHFIARLEEILSRFDNLNPIRESAIKQIQDKHNWQKTVSQYLPIYKNLMNAHAPKKAAAIYQ